MYRFRILHCLRAPVGGLFRHVRDLAVAQAERGHEVGVIADSRASDALTEQRLADLARHLALGLHRLPMSRELGWRDFTAASATARIAKQLHIQVIHGHGAKGGAYARLAARRLKRLGLPVTSLYTPHGGSLHYAPSSLKGRIFMALERNLAASTDAIVFESAYSSTVYDAHVRVPAGLSRIIPNGLLPHEFAPHLPGPDARDIVFVGELRLLKGVDVLLHAIAKAPVALTASIVGDGPDADRFKQLSARLGLADRVAFTGAMPAARAFALGRVLAMPSRAESFPYVVLEAAAAGIPLVATAVGGIPEIVAGTDTALIRPDDPDALSAALVGACTETANAAAKAARLKAKVAERFTVAGMSEAILALYAEAAVNDIGEQAPLPAAVTS